MAIKKGDTVFVNYTGTLDDGTVFDSTEGREPFEFVCGNGLVLPGFEGAVVGKDVGDKASVYIPVKEAYGERNEEMVITIAREEVPMHVTPEVGAHYRISVEQGEMDLVVTRADDVEVELDGNHPLAGKNLSFELEIVKVRPGLY